MLAGLALLAAAMGATALLLSQIDRPWLKRRLLSFVWAQAGVELDYQTVHFRGLHAIEIEALVVRSPASVRALAPELVRVGQLRIGYSLGALFHGGPAIAEVEIDQPALAMVIDDSGATSFDGLGGERSSSAHRSPSPLSHLPAEVLASLRWLGRVRVGGLVATVVRAEHAVPVERCSLGGLGLDLRLEGLGGRAEKPRLALSMGRPDAPLLLTLVRELGTNRRSSATVMGAWSSELTPDGAKAALDVRIQRQDLVPDISLDHLVQAEATVRFDAALGRTEAEFRPFSVGDGAVTAEASLVLPDGATPILSHGAIDADLARVLRIAPARFVPLRLREGELHARAEGVSLDRPIKSTSLSVEAHLADACFGSPGQAGAGCEARLGDTRISLHTKPIDAGLALDGSVSIDAVRGEATRTQLRGDGLSLTLRANGDLDGPYSGTAELRFARLEGTRLQGREPIRAMLTDGRVDLRANGIVRSEGSPLGAHGDVAIEAGLAAMEIETKAATDSKTPLTTLASGISLGGHARLQPSWPMALELSLGSARIRVLRPNGTMLLDMPARLGVDLKGIHPNFDHPRLSQGTARITLGAGALDADLDVDLGRRGDSVDYALHARAADLDAVRSFLPESAQRGIPWDRISFVLSSKGQLNRASSAEPDLHQESELLVKGASVGAFAARSVAFQLESAGTMKRQAARFDIRAKDIASGGAAVGDDHLAISTSFDRVRRSLDLRLYNEGIADTSLTLSASQAETEDAISYDLSGRVCRLASLARLLPKAPALVGLDLSELGLRVTSSGRISGLWPLDTPSLAPAGLPGGPAGLPGGPASSADAPRGPRGRGSANVEVEHLRWSLGDRAVRVPLAVLRTHFQTEDRRGSVEGDVQVEQAAIGLGRHQIAVTGFRDKLAVSAAGSVRDWTIDATQELAIHSVQQTVLPAYSIADLTTKMAAHWTAQGLIQVSDLEVSNGAAGTTFTGKGTVDWGEDRRRFAFRTSLEQDLSHISNHPEVFVGNGRVGVDLSLDSTDLRVFHARALLRLDDARVRLPGHLVTLEEMDGEVPIVADLRLGREGPDLLRDVRVNPYTNLRFADQHPLLSRRSFLSIGKISTPLLSIAPFAGNLRIEQNLLSFSQLEMGVRGGNVTGDGVLEWNGAGTKLHADLRATGVRSSHGEPFDGNAAFLINAADHSIEGRADILRIGKRHLLDLLDLQDPQHVDRGLNRIRTALFFGYPKNVQISFKHGFASAGVSLGGLARLISIDDVRGIPTGPLMERALESLKRKE